MSSFLHISFLYLLLFFSLWWPNITKERSSWLKVWREIIHHDRESMAAGSYKEMWTCIWTLDLLRSCQNRKKSAENAPIWHVPFSILTCSCTTTQGKAPSAFSGRLISTVKQVQKLPQMIYPKVYLLVLSKFNEANDKD